MHLRQTEIKSTTLVCSGAVTKQYDHALWTYQLLIRAEIPQTHNISIEMRE